MNIEDTVFSQDDTYELCTYFTSIEKMLNKIYGKD